MRIKNKMYKNMMIVKYKYVNIVYLLNQLNFNVLFMRIIYEFLIIMKLNRNLHKMNNLILKI